MHSAIDLQAFFVNNFTKYFEQVPRIGIQIYIAKRFVCVAERFCATLVLVVLMNEILKNDICNVRVSSVLNKDVKNYGKNNIFDGRPDSCWNSDEGSPQWVLLEFKEPYRISAFNIEFQGGFVGQDCLIEMNINGKVVTEPFYPSDMNGVQKFSLLNPGRSEYVKFLFNKSTDFFGRVIIYTINVFKK